MMLQIVHVIRNREHGGILPDIAGGDVTKYFEQNQDQNWAGWKKPTDRFQEMAVWKLLHEKETKT